MKEFWKGKRVFLTGHTGFKGSWLSLWLHDMGAIVTGYSLRPPTTPSLFEQIGLESLIESKIGDIRNREPLTEALIASGAEIVIHMAAQPLVRYSYQAPIETYETNVMGTLYLLDAVKKAVESGQNLKAVVNVTTDKCYENKEWVWGYRENEPLGGYDPYSSSKACSEILTASFRNSFFNPDQYSRHGVALASARAGNVIGGGDWAKDRLIPDCVRSLSQGEAVKIRNPASIRPWQHVLEPLSGYLILAEKLYTEGSAFAQAWNFGPNEADAKPVEWIVRRMCEVWGSQASYIVEEGSHPHEAHYLKLDCSKAKAHLGWHPTWPLEKTIDTIVEWTKSYLAADTSIRELCLRQIKEFMKDFGRG